MFSLRFLNNQKLLCAGLLISSFGFLNGCMTTNPYTQQRQISDTTVGSGIGIVSGALAGAVLGGEQGAYIGSALGGIAGVGIGHHLDTENTELQQRLAGTGIHVNKIGNSIQLVMASDITFETDQSTIRSNFYPVLTSVAQVLMKYDKTTIVVAGYTDNTGSAAHNQVLSEQRAQSVVDYFVNQAINKNRLFVQGYGSRNPIASNATATGRAMNRRVEITIQTL